MQPTAEEILSAVVEDYFERIEALSFAEMAAGQEGFRSSLAFGAAGIAYTCWYAARVLDDSGLLELAERWIREALARQRHRLAFRVPKSELAHRPRGRPCGGSSNGSRSSPASVAAAPASPLPASPSPASIRTVPGGNGRAISPSRPCSASRGTGSRPASTTARRRSPSWLSNSPPGSTPAHPAWRFRKDFLFFELFLS